MHLTDSPRCFQYYIGHAAIVHHVTRGRMPQTVNDIGQKLSGRRSNIVRTKEDDGLIGFSGFRSMMDKQMAVKCNYCGLLGPVDVRLNVTRLRGSGPPRCKSCANENDRDKFTAISLALKRGNFWKANVEEQSDHLVALQVEQDNGFVLSPALLVPNEEQLVWDGITGGEVLTVMVPNTPAACKRLEGLSMRAFEDLNRGLAFVTQATEGSRILLLQDFKALIQVLSVVYRQKMAAFRQYQIDQVTGGKKSAKGQISRRSTKQISASYKAPTFDSVTPAAIVQHFPWSDSAVGVRAEESGARDAFYGKVKTFIEVRVLADKPVHWSRRLKTIVVKSFERDVTETTGGVLTVTCDGGCTLASCSNEHLGIDEFLDQTMVGLQRLTRLPLLMNYLKAKLFCFEQTVLKTNYSHWDFKLKFDKDTWDVRLVGHAWDRKRMTVNKKVARRLVQSDVGIVKRLLQRPEALETVSLDPSHLRIR